jgi:hypothetical protein
MDTTLTGFPFPEPSDAITDYPAVAQLLAEEIEQQGCVLYDSGYLAVAASLDTGTLVVPPGVKGCRVVGRARGTVAATSHSGYLRLNNDANLVYDHAYIGREGSSVQQFSGVNVNAVPLSALFQNPSMTAGKFNTFDFHFPDAFLVGSHAFHGVHGVYADTTIGGSYSHTALYNPAVAAAISRIAFLAGGGSAAIGSRLLVLGTQ